QRGGGAVRGAAQPRRALAGGRGDPRLDDLHGRRGTRGRRGHRAAAPGLSFSMPNAWLAVVRVETTVRATYEREAGARKRAVGFKADREIDSADTWMFTDGASTGWHSLVVLRPGQDPRLMARQARTETRNVGAELAGLVSALEAVLPGERVAIVCDFL